MVLLTETTTTPFSLPADDITDAVGACAADLKSWRGARLLLTGGTGVLGSWLLSTIIHANDLLGLDLRTCVLTRSPQSLPGALLGRSDVAVIPGDVRNAELPGTFDLVLHGAAGASTPFGVGDAAPREMASTIVDGTRRVLECAARNRARLVFLSSGAVYGPQLAPVAESSPGAPDPLDVRSSYGEAKRLAEWYCAAATAAGEVDAVIARLFAFVGPRIPTDSYYAAGNFMGDLLAGGAVQVAGDGRPRRSYLYCGDLPEWCFAIASRGASGEAYNVGSDEAITIADLAREITALDDRGAPVEIHTPEGSGPAPWYVPVTEKARRELGLTTRVGLGEGLRRWRRWLLRTGA